MRLPLAAILALLVPAAGLAAPLTDYGGIGRWNITASSPPITYFIDPSIASLASTVQAAFTAWQSIPTVFITFTQVQAAAGAQITVSAPSDLSISGAGGVAIPVTDRSGSFQSCSATISTSVVSDGGAAALSTITHEIGHCLGLQHSVVSGAVMSYRNSASSPTDDDRFALTMLYPAGGAGGYPAGCATVRSVGGGRGPRPPAGPMILADACLAAIMAASLRLARKRGQT